MGEHEVELVGGWHTAVSRRGDVVLRAAGPQSPTVIALLHHLHRHGFEAAPRPGDSFAPDGRERLQFRRWTTAQRRYVTQRGGGCTFPRL